LVNFIATSGNVRLQLAGELNNLTALLKENIEILLKGPYFLLLNAKTKSQFIAK
jgi:hypothetical protein